MPESHTEGYAERYVEVILAPNGALKPALERVMKRRRLILASADELANLVEPPLAFALWPNACEVTGVRYAALYPDDATRLFHTTRDLSVAAPDVLVVGVVADPVFLVRAKLYLGGEIIGKIGDEPDHELLFDVQPSPVSRIETLAETHLGLRPPHTLPARALAESRRLDALATLFVLSSQLLTTHRELASDPPPGLELLHFARL